MSQSKYNQAWRAGVEVGKKMAHDEILYDFLYEEKIPIEVIEKIKKKIEELNPVDFGSMFSYEAHRGAADMQKVCLDIIERYMEE